jgi:hypothetical protein
MSQFNVGPEKGLVAASAIGDGVIVKTNSSKQAVIAAAATDVLLGVTDGAVSATGDIANVRLRSAQGTLKVKLGGTVAVNDAITSNGSGLGVTTTTAGNQILGYALEAGVSGDFIEVLPATGKF